MEWRREGLSSHNHHPYHLPQEHCLSEVRLDQLESEAKQELYEFMKFELQNQF